jgi:hypothetical protein
MQTDVFNHGGDAQVPKATLSGSREEFASTITNNFQLMSI